MKLLTICPSRGRPRLLARMLQSFWQTRNPGTEAVIYVDEADPTLPRYLRVKNAVELRVGPFLWMAEVVNRAVTEWHPNFDYYQIINDDHVYRTPKWDELLIGAIELAGGWGYAYGKTENLPTAAVVSSNIVRALGFYFPPGFRHQFVDNYERDLFSAADMAIHVPEVFIEHMHPAFGKGTPDETYAKAQREAFEHDARRYADWKANEMAGHVASLMLARQIAGA